MAFIETTHLQDILEHSTTEPVIVFKYSNSCGSSSRLKNDLLEKINTEQLSKPIYIVTVQTHRALSNKISEWFNIKHESPQIFLISHGKILYTAHHKDIDLDKII